MQNEEIKKEIGSLHSILENDRAKGKYRVPEGYFENLQEKVIEQSRKNQYKPAKTKLRFLGNRRNLVAYAAAIVLIIGGSLVFSKLQKDASIPLDNEQIYAYLDENVDDLNINEMIEWIEDEDFFYDMEDLNSEDLDFYLDEYLDEMSEEDIQIYL